MAIIPAAKVSRFEQLEAGDLFLYMDHGHRFYALKTQPPPGETRGEMVILGPSFIENANESFLLPWEAATVLSLGKEFSILLPTEASAWFGGEPSRTPVCLALIDERAFICTNCSRFPQRYVPCFVEIETGAVHERQLPGLALFTTSWEIAVLGHNHPPRTILKYPLPERE